MASAMSLSMIALFAIVAVAFAADPDHKTWKEGKAKEKESAEAAAADEAKMAAVNKIITLLEDLQKQVLAEGEEEAKTYNKFSCFCKTTQKGKTEAIKTGKDDKASLSADIEKFTGQRAALDKKIAGLQKDIKEAEDAMKKTTSESDAAHAVYSTNDADMKAALSALQEAIKVLKSSKTPSLVQMRSISKTVRQAALIADALGLGGDSAQRVASFFIQQDAKDVPVEMEDYKFHSGGIIETLEKLLGEFRSKKADIDAEEVERVKTFDMFMQDKTDYVKAKNHELDETKAARDGKTEDIGSASQELSTVSATLLDDMEYLDELNTICSEKAKTWDQRSKVRADELTAITQATGIIKSTVAAKTQSSTIRFAQTHVTLRFADAIANSDDAMEAIEADAESAEDDGSPLGFLQKAKKHAVEPKDGAREAIMALLRNQGQKLKSTLLTSLASRIAADPFAKIKKLIQELIERLLTEAANEANQKGWCDKATADATQKRTYAADKIESLNAKMAKLEALGAKLKEEISVLEGEIKELKNAQADASKERAAEKAENAKTVSEAKAGLDAVKMAIDILDKFYKTAAKESVDLSLAQGPLDDAPDTTFKTGEAYQGASAESGGIIGMMEVIESDFVRTIKETKKAEEQAEEDHLAFMTESGKSLAEKNIAKKEKTRLNGETEENFNDAEDSLDAQTKILATSIKELMELKSACVDTGMSYADRIAMREQEIASLKKALCILGAYAEYGPDGLSDAC
jgi:hypothetical protein